MLCFLNRNRFFSSVLQFLSYGLTGLYLVQWTGQVHDTVESKRLLQWNNTKHFFFNLLTYFRIPVEFASLRDLLISYNIIYYNNIHIYFLIHLCIYFIICIIYDLPVFDMHIFILISFHII